jgi:hypothetical protein
MGGSFLIREIASRSYLKNNTATETHGNWYFRTANFLGQAFVRVVPCDSVVNEPSFQRGFETGFRYWPGLMTDNQPTVFSNP